VVEVVVVVVVVAVAVAVFGEECQGEGRVRKGEGTVLDLWASRGDEMVRFADASLLKT